MKSPSEALPLPELYYSHLSQDYWMPDAKGRWIKITETSAKRYLNDQGSSGAELDKVLLRIQKERNVSYVGKLAGYMAGFYELNGHQLLITESPKWIEPKAGEWPLLDQLLKGMLTPEQLEYQYGWLKCTLQAMRTGQWAQAQVLAFAGPVNSGKSIWQALLTVILGGRSAKPFLYMSGRTVFNADLLQAEHLIIEDECESNDIRTRRQFGAQIKQQAVNQEHHCHGKGKEGLLLRPLQRTTISLNDDPERLLVLPPMTPDVADKIMLFKVERRPMPMPTETAEQKQVFWNALVAELPAFVDAMLKFEIPAGLRCPRFGVTHYHHPEILQALEDTAPEVRLLNLIDEHYFSDERFGGEPKQELRVSALEVEQQLTDKSSRVCREANRLLSHSNSCGIYLGRLTQSSEGRVIKRSVNGKSRWIIRRPATEGDQVF